MHAVSAHRTKVWTSVLILLIGSTVVIRADCNFGKGLACFPVFSSCAFTAGFGGRDPYLQCIDTLSNHWCTECVTDKGLDPRPVVCPAGGGFADKLTDCPGYGRSYLAVQMAYAGRTVGPNQDGRLEVAFGNASGGLSHLWQASPNGTWVTSAAAFSGSTRAASFPAMVRYFDGRLDVFVVTAAGSVAHVNQVAPNVNWGSAADIGGRMRPGGISVAIDSTGKALVAGLGVDGAIWYTHQSANQSFPAWRSLGGNFAASPIIGQNADGRLEIFAVAANGSLLHSWQPVGRTDFVPWVSMGTGPFTGTPAVGRNLDQRLELFVTTAGGALAHAWQTAPNGGWTRFAETPGKHVFDPAVIMNIDGTLDVFVVGVADRALWHRRQVAPNTGWGDWKSLGGSVTSTPAVARNVNGTTEVLAIGQDGAIWRTRQTAPAGSAWTPWERIGGLAKATLF